MKVNLSIFLTIGSILFSCLIAAQQAIPIMILSDTAEYHLKIENLDFLQESDSLDRLRLREVISEEFKDKFRLYDSSKIENKTNHNIWLRFQLINSSGLPLKMCIKQAGDDNRFYFKRRSGKTDTTKTTIKFNFNNGELRETEINIQPFNLDTNELVIAYFSGTEFKDINRQVKKIAFDSFLETTKEAINVKRFSISNPLVYNSFFAGILFFTSILVLSFYLTSRYKPYLYAFLINIMLTIISIGDVVDKGFGLEIILSYIFFVFFTFYYIRNLFELRSLMPRFDKFMKRFTLWLFPVLLFVLIISIIIFDKTTAVSRTSTFMFSLYPVIIVSMIYLSLIIAIPFSNWRKKKQEFIFFNVAFLPMILLVWIPGSVEFLVSQSGYLTNKYDWIVKLAFVWTSLWLLFDVISRYKRQTLELNLSVNENQRIQLEKERDINELIQNKNFELEETVKTRTQDLTTSLINLQAAQERLIQSEKLAHLGQLTAGVAHEIQNPLNFINNFSELNKELADELIVEINSNKLAEVSTLAESIKSNSDKISYHGKRADSIVKSMLQHSRYGSGSFSATDINNLLDEAWRLCYHGFRAKDKLFNVRVNYDFDRAIDKININAEEISRVFMNLVNNALYATREHWKQRMHDPEYLPSIELITNELEAGVQIQIKDNGIGIPSNIQPDIFNPFFTTKPTGEGVGLGLSLVFDIITKGHGGSIDFESKEGMGTTFTVLLPIS